MLISITLLVSGIQMGLYFGFLSIILLVYLYFYLKNEIEEIKGTIQSAKEKRFERKYSYTGNNEISLVGKLLNELIEDYEKTLEKRRMREKEFLTILDAIPSPIFIVNHEGIVNVSNKASSKIFRDIKIKKDIHYYEIIYIEELNSIIRNVLESAEVPIKSFSQDKTIYEVSVFKFVSRDEKFYLFYLSDITENEKLKELQKNFITSITHEIRSPLSVILGSTEILSRERLSRNERINLMELLKNNTERINSLVTKIAELYALEQYSKSMEEVVDLKEVCEVVYSKYHDMANSKNLNFICKASSVFVKGERFLLEELLSNLVENAIKYTKEGTVQVSITQKEKAVIIVSDTGEGIHEDSIKRVFEPFEKGRLSQSHVSYGLGLGLSIVKRITELHNGEIRIKSVPYQGTEVEVQLPIVKNN